MFKIVLMRHGESMWNLENKFTGWTDIKLSKKGIKEAKKAGKLLEINGFKFDLAYTSLLERANETLRLCLSKMGGADIKIIRNWRLNERHYGALQGLNKKETAVKYGEKQVLLWRRSFEIKPPELDTLEHEKLKNSQPYINIDPRDIPKSESLEDVVKRFLPIWKNNILNSIKVKKIIVVAHGNSLRALIMHLKNLTKEEIIKLNIPTGIPLVITLNKNLEIIDDYYLGDQNEIKNKISAVSNQSKL